jgi:glutathione synthase/RimK-type ligase-like ATP-grasp enzyme
MDFHWCGPRLSDIKNISIFNKSTTIYGNGILNNTSYCHEKKYRINHNVTNLDLDVFFIKKLMKEIEQNPNVKFMHYNPCFAYEYGELIMSHSVCMNTRSMLVTLNEKMETKAWLSNYCNNIPSIVLPLNKCNEIELRNIFPDANKFVIQKNIGAGGFGTMILNYKQESNQILDSWDSNEELLVTPYLYPSIPINIHIVVFEEEVLLLPPSVQLICPNYNGQLIYRGADYAAYYHLNEDVKKSILANARVIGEQLRRYAYRGVAGIDFLSYRNIVYFIEINPRFQASTALLNKALLAQELPSVQELNLQSFQISKLSYNIPIINVPYSNFCYDSNDEIAKHILNRCENHNSIELDLDGYDDGDSDNNSYQFRVNFPYNISGLNPDGCINIHDNILGNPPLYLTTYRKIIQIKFELLNQGIIIKPFVLAYINKTNKIRSAVFDSIDITIFGSLKVNCPYDVKLSEFSPYSIDMEDNVLLLKRYEQTISNVYIDLVDILSNHKTSNNVEYSKIATLAADRIRINHTGICKFKPNATSCAFCNLPKDKISYDYNDICQVIDEYLKNCNFRHFLIGGGSSQGFTEIERIVEIVKYIKQKCDKSIYVMCLPPENSQWVEILYKAGVDEIAFNIEIFDREIAMKIMPGKGLIPLQCYYDRLKQAVNLWGQNGKVKSIAILGLETQESTMQGIEMLCNIGVQPVLSAFRPLKNTLLENVIPMPSEQILDIYFKAEKLCKKFGLYLGPICFECQNNTVSFHPSPDYQMLF